jgi:hypothetical protein
MEFIYFQIMKNKQTLACQFHLFYVNNHFFQKALPNKDAKEKHIFHQQHVTQKW